MKEFIVKHKKAVIISGAVLVVGLVLWYGYKHGWFKRKDDGGFKPEEEAKKEAVTITPDTTIVEMPEKLRNKAKAAGLKQLEKYNADHSLNWQRPLSRSSSGNEVKYVQMGLNLIHWLKTAKKNILKVDGHVGNETAYLFAQYINTPLPTTLDTVSPLIFSTASNL